MVKSYVDVTEDALCARRVRRAAGIRMPPRLPEQWHATHALPRRTFDEPQAILTNAGIADIEWFTFTLRTEL